MRDGVVIGELSHVRLETINDVRTHDLVVQYDLLLGGASAACQQGLTLRLHEVNQVEGLVLGTDNATGLHLLLDLNQLLEMEVCVLPLVQVQTLPESVMSRLVITSRRCFDRKVVGQRLVDGLRHREASFRMTVSGLRVRCTVRLIVRLTVCHH